MNSSITPYVISVVTAFVFLLISIVIAQLIQYQSAVIPKDPLHRKIWFWVLALLNAAAAFSLGYYVFKPELNIMLENEYINSLSIGTSIGFVLYILLGFILSKIFKNGKLGHWF